MRRFGPKITGVPAQQDDGGEFVQMVRSLMVTGGRAAEAAKLVERNNGTLRLIDFLSKGVEPAVTSDPAWAGAFASDDGARISRAFIASMRNASAFYRLFLDEMMILLPVDTRIIVTTMNATAWVVGQGMPRPLTKMEFAGANVLWPMKACALMVASEELLKASGRAGEEAFGNELRRALGLVVDETFFGLTVDEETPTIASAGQDADDALRDLRSLFAACNLKSDSRPLLVCAADVARGAATLAGLTGERTFPEMGPLGGDLCDVPAMVSDAVPSGTLTLIDGAGIAGNVGRVSLDMTNKAAIEMAVSTDLQQIGAEGVGAELVSLWQNHLEAIMTSAIFAVKRLRPNATARLTGVTWGPEEAAS